jgi:hypothetical protein
MSQDPTIEFSVDLVTRSLEHRDFLRAVHLRNMDLYKFGDHLMNAIYVYLNCWLPYVSLNSEHWVFPSLEVAWVWHVHKMDPIRYRKDCIEWFGRVVDAPDDVSPFQFSIYSPEIRRSSSPVIAGPDFVEKICASAERQACMLWQLRWPVYDDPWFLREALDRYLKMLQLMKKHSRQLIIPTYDMDNMWHSHMASPSAYLNDCIRIVGREVKRN